MVPSLDLIPAGPDQQPVLANMLELYEHDFSEFLRIPDYQGTPFPVIPSEIPCSDSAELDENLAQCA